MEHLVGKVAVITGAGRGIGQRTAVRLAQMKIKTVLISRTESQLDETAGLVVQAGGTPVVIARRVQTWVYVLSSLLCWLTAIVMMSRINSAGADIAQSYLLITILAAILGSIDPYGGFGRVTGLIVALLILQTISSGFNLLGFNQHLTLALWGFTLVAVMAVKRITGVLVARCRSR